MKLVQCRPNNNDPMKEFFDFGQDLFYSPFVGTDRMLTNLKGAWYPALDVVEDKETITIKADIPGLKKEDINVAVDNNILTIRGERKSETEKNEKNYHRVERFYGVFERSLDLGTAVDQTGIKAKYQDGILEVVLPKSEKAKLKQISIE